MINIISPTSSSDLAQISQLLARTLRDSPLEWNYCEEYPLALSQDNINRLSHCVYVDNELAAHATLLKRSFTPSNTNTPSYSLGFIGNVATSPKFRGQGLQKKLMAHLEEIALLQNIDALVLWSDLIEFYQKLGFTSIGREKRFQFNKQEIKKHSGVKFYDPIKMNLSMIQEFQNLRPALPWNIERSPQEFLKLLNIPDTFLFINKSQELRSCLKGSESRREETKKRSLPFVNEHFLTTSNAELDPFRQLLINAYYIIGKGSDMQGIIHEWGASNPKQILGDLQSIMMSHDLPSLTLLASSSMAPSLLKQLENACSSVEIHHTALAKPINSKGDGSLKAIAQSYIWGLDSI